MYLIVVDYNSRWFEVRQLQTVTARSVIRVLCELFATHGIPDTVVSDNGPQYANQEFASFAKEWGFVHVTSSPTYAQSNGEIERAVQTAKNILTKNTNPYLVLLAYRTAPLRNGLSPSELLMSRRLRTRLPTIPEVLQPKEVDREEVGRKEEVYREKYAKSYDSCHKVISLPALEEGDDVFIRDQQKFGRVQERLSSPRSYQVLTETGASIRRNRRSLIHTGRKATAQDRASPPAPDSEGDSSPDPELPPIALLGQNKCP